MPPSSSKVSKRRGRPKGSLNKFKLRNLLRTTITRNLKAKIFQVRVEIERLKYSKFILFVKKLS